jgi:hypothetical protein
LVYIRDGEVIRVKGDTVLVAKLRTYFLQLAIIEPTDEPTHFIFILMVIKTSLVVECTATWQTLPKTNFFIKSI